MMNRYRYISREQSSQVNSVFHPPTHTPLIGGCGWRGDDEHKPYTCPEEFTNSMVEQQAVSMKHVLGW